MTASLLYPLFIVAGALQSLGKSRNAQLRGRLVNPWLAATVSFLPIVSATLFLVMPLPLPTLDALGRMPWYAPFGGLAFVDGIGAGAFNGLLATANLLTSIAPDHFGWVGMKRVRVGAERLGRAGLMAGGILLISAF